MTALDIFMYSGQQVRTVLIDGEPWFVAADVARILGYRMASDMTRRLDDDEKGTHSARTPGGEQEVTIVNEPGLFMAILGSQVADARTFKRWVTHEVLPQIRKTGQFGTALPASFAEALELAAATVRELEAAEARIALDAPKVAAWDELMDADGFYSFEAAGKLLGIGRNTLFARLRAAGVIQSGSRLPYQRYMHHFKLTTGTRENSLGELVPTQTTRVRPSGLTFIQSKLGLVAVAS